MDEEGAPGARSFGPLLRRHRLDAGLSQAALAERARMSTNAISALERGYRRTPQRGTLALLCGALALNEPQRAAFELAAARPTVARLPLSASALPIALTSFVGRETELAQVATLVRERRLVTIAGPGGIGKTQTALQCAATLTDAAQDAVWFVDFAPLANPALVTSAIAAAFDLHESPDLPLLDAVRNGLQERAVLLVLDNCEHVVEEAARVAEALLLACPRLRILTTSREPLRCGGEYVYRLPSLDDDASVALFVDRAVAADPGFALHDGNAALIAQLCRRLDGIPLAIELAAASVNVLSLEAIVEMLADRLRLLRGDGPNRLRRQQTMRAVIDWSYDLLAEPERRMFEQFAVFAGGCTLRVAETVCRQDVAAGDPAFALISSLLDKSFITADFDGSEPRYSLLESFRQYAAEKLEHGGETELTARRHATAYLAEAELLDRAYDSQPDDVWRGLVREGLDNWRVALQWALVDGGDVVLGQRLAAELRVIWQYFAPLEGQRWLALAQEAEGPATPAAVRGKLEFTSALVAWVLRDQKEHLERSERAVALYRDLDDALGLARCQNLAGHALVSLGRFDEAMPRLQEALALARGIPNRRLIAYTLRTLAWAIGVGGGDLEAARANITEALRIYEELGAKLNVAFTLYDLGECEFSAGAADLALTHAAESVAMLRSFNDAPLVATALDSMTVYLVWLARYDEAHESAREVLELARTNRLEVLTAYALQHFAAIALLRGRPVHEQAARVLGFVDARLSSTGALRLRNQEQREYDRVRTMLEELLGADRLGVLMGEGATATEDAAVAAALEI